MVDKVIQSEEEVKCSEDGGHKVFHKEEEVMESVGVGHKVIDNKEEEESLERGYKEISKSEKVKEPVDSNLFIYQARV